MWTATERLDSTFLLESELSHDNIIPPFLFSLFTPFLRIKRRKKENQYNCQYNLECCAVRYIKYRFFFKEKRALYTISYIFDVLGVCCYSTLFRFVFSCHRKYHVPARGKDIREIYLFPQGKDA